MLLARLEWYISHACMIVAWVITITWARISPSLLKRSRNAGQVIRNDNGIDQQIEHLPGVLILL